MARRSWPCAADGVVMAGDQAGHRWQPDQPPAHGQGLSRRPPLRGRHRRRRAGRRDGQALPALSAGALREGRGRAASWRQGQPVEPDGAGQPAPPPCRAWPNSPLLFAGFDLGSPDRSPVRVRRHRRPLRGERPRQHRLRLPARRHRGGLEARPPGGAVDLAPQGASSRPPTRIPPPAGPTWSGASTRPWPPSPARAPALERDEIAERFQGLLDSMDGGLAS